VDKLRANPLPCFQGANQPDIILDATELHIESPTNLAVNRMIYSAYKSGNTVKILIGMLLGRWFLYLMPIQAGSAIESLQSSAWYWLCCRTGL
jgi:hypothetical protein